MYAQHFFCSTFNTASTLDKLSQFLLSYHAYVFDFNVPNVPNLSNFQKFCASQFSTGITGMMYTTSGGLSCRAFGKNGLTNSDLYEDYVASGLGAGLIVESWCGGTYGNQCQQSDCQGSPIVNPSTPQNGKSVYGYNSIDIEEFKFASNLYFKTDYNHGKFALSYPSGANWFCPADINRMYSQRHRGGGALCFQNPQFYSLMNSAITKLNTTCGNK